MFVITFPLNSTCLNLETRNPRNPAGISGGVESTDNWPTAQGVVTIVHLAFALLCRDGLLAGICGSGGGSIEWGAEAVRHGGRQWDVVGTDANPSTMSP
jgi:hypothetical protein